MPLNIEVKAQVKDMGTVKSKVEQIATSGPVYLCQEDTFFHIPTGRLKLRTLMSKNGEIIYYRRPDTALPVQSRYYRLPIVFPHMVKWICSAILGVKGVVRKQRTLYRIGETRVHLDQVEGLGDFIELEVPVPGGESANGAEAEATKMMEALSIGGADLVSGAYVDLLGAWAAPG